MSTSYVLQTSAYNSQQCIPHKSTTYRINDNFGSFCVVRDLANDPLESRQMIRMVYLQLRNSEVSKLRINYFQGSTCVSQGSKKRATYLQFEDEAGK